MNFLTRLVRPYFSVEKRSSLEQLRKDFGAFPPTPLQCDSHLGDFDVVRTGGIGQIYHDLAVQLRVLDADMGSLSTDLVAKFGAHNLNDLRNTSARLGPRSSWVIKRLVFVWLFVVRSATAFRSGLPRPDAQGLFVPLFKDGLQIVLRAQRHQSKSDAHIVSHEHIHLLQHRHPESHSRAVRSPRELLSEEACADAFILYVLEKKEVEARLHESVLSFYRSHKNLPTTVSGFLGLLASSETIGSLVTSILESGDVVFQKGLLPYPEREARPVEHLVWILEDIKAPEMQRRFVTEVLPVMYGNLIKYYGDDRTSRSFLEGIARPNFYDELYADQTT